MASRVLFSTRFVKIFDVWRYRNSVLSFHNERMIPFTRMFHESITVIPPSALLFQSRQSYCSNVNHATFETKSSKVDADVRFRWTTSYDHHQRNIDEIVRALEYSSDQHETIHPDLYRLAMEVILKEDTVPLQAVTSLLELATCQTFMVSNEEKLEHVEQLWQHLLTKQIKLDVGMFNLRIGAHYTLGKDIEVVGVLSEMTEHLVLPDSVTYTHFIEIFCNEGDIDSAHDILRHMKLRNVPIQTEHVNNIIKGHFKSGHPLMAVEEAQKMKSEYNLEPDVQTYTYMITGFAELGNLAQAKKIHDDILKKGMQVAPNVWTKAVVPLLKKRKQSEAKQVLSFVPDKCLSFPESWHFMQALMKHGFYHIMLLAHQKIFPDASKTVGFCVSAMLSNMTADEFVRYLPYRMTDLQTALEQISFLHMPDRLLVFVTALEKLGNKPDPHPYSIIMRQYSMQGNLRGIINMLPKLPKEMQISDAIDIESQLSLSLQQFDKTDEESARLLQTHLSEDSKLKQMVNSSMIDKILSKDLKLALRYVSSTRGIVSERIENLHDKLQKYIPGRWEEVFQFMMLYNKKTDAEKCPNLAFNAIEFMMDRDLPIKKPLHFILAEKLCYGELRIQVVEKILSCVPMKMKQQFIGALEDSDDLQLLEHSSSKQVNSEKPAKKLQLCQHYCWHGNRPGLALYYLLSLLKTKPSLVDRELLLLVTSELYSGNNLDDVLDVLKLDVGNSAMPTDQTDYKRCITQLVNKVPSLKQLIILHKTLCHADYLMMPDSGEAFWLAFLQSTTARGHREEILQMLAYMIVHQQGGLSKPQLHDLFTILLKSDKKKDLQQIMFLLKKCQNKRQFLMTDNDILFILAAANVETGKDKMAEKIIQTPGFVLDTVLLWQYCNRWCQHGKPEITENFYDVVKHLHTKMEDQRQHLFMVLQGYCHIRGGKVHSEKAAKRIYLKKFRQEDLYVSNDMSLYFHNAINTSRQNNLQIWK